MLNKFIKNLKLLLNRDLNSKSRTQYFDLIRDSSWLFSANTIIYLLAFVQGILVARYLTVEIYGIFGLITLFVLTINQIVDSRVWETVIKYTTQFIQQQSYEKANATITIAYLTDILTGLIAFIFVLLIAPIAAQLLIKDTAYTPLIRLYGIVLLIMVPQDTSSAVIKTAKKFNWLANQTLVEAIVRFCCIVVVIIIDANILGLIVAYLITATISTITLLIMSYRGTIILQVSLFKLKAIRTIHQEYKEMFRFLILTNGQALLKLVRDADALFVGLFLTPYDVGLYRVAKNTVALMYFPITPIYITSYPKFNSLWQSRQYLELKILIRHLWKMFTTIGVFELIVMWIFGGQIILLTVGQDYLEGQSILNWLALATAVSISVNFGYPLLITCGLEKRAFTAMALGTIFQISILLITLPIIGLIGAGISNLTFHLFWAMIIFSSRNKIWRHAENIEIKSL